jgi:hypothetical protein
VAHIALSLPATSLWVNVQSGPCFASLIQRPGMSLPVGKLVFSRPLTVVGWQTSQLALAEPPAWWHDMHPAIFGRVFVVASVVRSTPA